MVSLVILFLSCVGLGFDLPPAECTRSKHPTLCSPLASSTRSKRVKRRRQRFITPRHLAFLYGSEFWCGLPHLVKERIVYFTAVAEHRRNMQAVCREINDLPICPRYGFAILTERQLGRRFPDRDWFLTGDPDWIRCDRCIQLRYSQLPGTIYFHLLPWIAATSPFRRGLESVQGEPMEYPFLDNNSLQPMQIDDSTATSM